MSRFIPYVFMALGLFFLLRGLAALLLLVVMIVLIPFLIATYRRARNKEYNRVSAILSKTERTLNAHYEQLYFAEGAPPDRDENGIPYL